MQNILVSLVIFLLLMQVLVFLIALARRFLQPRGPFTVRINEDRELVVDSVDTLLNHLYAQNIFIPSSCGGQGTCGLCRVQVVSPVSKPSPVEEEQIPAGERSKGFRLACAVKVQSAMHIRIPPEILDAREQEAIVSAAGLVTSDIIHLEMKVDEDFSFHAGQYIQIQIPSPESPRGYEFRAYSIASDPTVRGTVELAVKLVPQGLGSTWLHTRKPGDRLIFTGPYGEWRMDPDPERGLLLVGGGVGLTPLRSILYAASAMVPDKPVQFFYGARTEADAFWTDEWRLLQEKHPHWRFEIVLSHEPETSGWTGSKGFVHEEVDRSASLSAQAFLCGPPPMIEALLPVLEDKGMSSDQIFTDAF